MIYLRGKILLYLASKALLLILVTEKFIILAKYLDFIDFFLKKLAAELFMQRKINKHIINLELDKKLPYTSIYSLKSVKLEILKPYIKINLASHFIQLFKSSIKGFILFV